MFAQYLLALFLTVLGLPTLVSAIVHPGGIVNSLAQLEFMKAKVNAGAQPWLSAWQAILNKNYINWNSNPHVTLVIDIGMPPPQPADDLQKDSDAAYGAALGWIITGNIAYANKSKAILMDWANTMTLITGAQKGLNVAWYSPRMAFAAEILKRVPGSGWSAGDQTIFDNWVRTKLLVMNGNAAGNLQTTASGNPIPVSTRGTSVNNWAAFGASARMTWGVYLDNQTLYNQGLGDTKKLITHYISNFGNNVPPGWTLETCRLGNGTTGTLAGGDLTHTNMALGAFGLAAEISKQQGTENLYAFVGADDGNGLRTALLYHQPFYYWPDRPGSSIATWKCKLLPSDQGGSGNPYSWYAAYNHYRDPIFLTMANYRGVNVPQLRMWGVPWDTLTHNYTGLVIDPPPEDECSLCYISTTGSATTTCTQAAPCTFARATSIAVPGATIRLLDGTHTATCNDCLPNGISATQPTILESANVSGTPLLVGTRRLSVNPGMATLRTDTPTVITIPPGRKFITVRNLGITTTAASINPAMSVGGSDILVDNLEVQAPTRTGAATGIKTLIGSARITVKRNRIHRAGPVVDFDVTAPTVHGIFAEGVDHVIEDNDIYDNQGEGIRVTSSSATSNHRTAVRFNRVYGNGGKGIMVGDGNDQRVTGNLAFANGGQGIYLTNTGKRIMAWQNSVYANSLQAGQQLSGIFINSNGTGIIRNNISLGHPVNEIIITPTTTVVACSNNLSGDATDNAKCTNWTFNGVATDVWNDPNNATLANRDFTLKAGSAAIDNGTTGICVTADVTANRCTPALTLATFTGAAPDQGAYESNAAPVSTTVVDLDMDNDVQDDSGQGNHGTAVSVTFDATNKIEGTHSAVFNAASDRIDVPLVGFNVKAFTIAMSAWADSFGPTNKQFMFGHTTTPPSLANIIQMYIGTTGSLSVGLGGNQGTFTNIFQFTLDRFYRVVLVVTEGAVAGSGTAKVYVDGVQVASGTYSGLAQVATAGAIGNNDTVNDRGWIGLIDKVLIRNAAWSPTEVAADCTAHCLAPVTPFDPLVLSNCEQGTISATTLTCDAAGNPDPADCTPLTDFDVVYSDDLEGTNPVTPTTTACSLTGTNPANLRLTLSAAPTAAQFIRLTYQPTASEEEVDNHISPSFSPLVLTSCATDTTGLEVICGVQGTPNPDECDTLSNFLIRDECGLPVAATGCILTTSPPPSVLKLQRAAPPINGTVGINLTYVPSNQVIGVENNFAPGAPVGVTQVGWWCRPDGPTADTRWSGTRNSICRVPSPGAINVRFALANATASAVESFSTALFCAKDGGPFTRVTENFDALGVRYSGLTSLGVPDNTLLSSEALAPEGGLTFAGVGRFRRQRQALATPTLEANRKIEEEHSIIVAEGLPLGTTFDCRLHEASGTPFPSYTGIPGCTTHCGARIVVDAPRPLVR